jgi:hypothetical protein
VCDDGPVDRVVIGNEQHGLILHNVVRGGADDIWWQDVAVVDAGLRAELTVPSN